MIQLFGNYGGVESRLLRSYNADSFQFQIIKPQCAFLLTDRETDMIKSINLRCHIHGNLFPFFSRAELLVG